MSTPMGFWQRLLGRRFVWFVRDIITYELSMLISSLCSCCRSFLELALFLCGGSLHCSDALGLVPLPLSPSLPRESFTVCGGPLCWLLILSEWHWLQSSREGAVLVCVILRGAESLPRPPVAHHHGEPVSAPRPLYLSHCLHPGLVYQVLSCQMCIFTSVCLGIILE